MNILSFLHAVEILFIQNGILVMLSSSVGKESVARKSKPVLAGFGKEVYSLGDFYGAGSR